MEYREDREFCQAAVRCRFIDLNDVQRATSIQSREKASGGQPRTIESILLDEGHVSQGRARLVQAAGGFRKRNLGTRTIGPYRILGRIARGGMGSVLRGVDGRNGRCVAVKILNADATPVSRRRFGREAATITSLSHPNIVKGLEVGWDGDVEYFAMEHVDGETLGERLARKGRLPEQEALKITLQVARALECARKAQIVHRDVKPDNILVTSDGTAKLCDLGLARPIFQESRITEAGITLGTPDYISPEQARGVTDLDSRSDIYSLGITLYHALVGEPPFKGTSAGVVISKHLSKEVPPPCRRRLDISSGTNALVMKMTRKSRSDRHPTPWHLAQEIQVVLESLGDPPKISRG